MCGSETGEITATLLIGAEVAGRGAWAEIVPFLHNLRVKGFRRRTPSFWGAVRFVQVHLRLGIALRCLGRPDDALKEFYCAVRLAPNDPEAHYHLGMALKGQDDFDGATAAFRLAVALKPDFEKAVTI